MTLSKELLAKLADQPEEVREEVSKISMKMISLGFPAFFERLEEGPILRTFFFKPTAGALFSKILTKDEEIAGTLSVESVRIERQLGTISIAVPRSDRQLIRFDKCLHEMFASEKTQGMVLPLLLGQEPAGQYLYADLQEQPHLLVAGTTGSGKSIFTAQLICSLALFRSPEELEFVLVDTKNLDLVLFESLSHVSRMVRTVEVLREELVSALNIHRARAATMTGLVRNIKEWNASGMGMPFKYRIIIIDELADIIKTDNEMWAGVPKKDRPTSIITLIQQVSQVSRATGIHFIAATQRPSVKIIDGDVKANFPARICFKVATMQDSRVILDENGAEKLLGKGDYLYKITGSDTVKRAHSAFVTMADIATITSQHENIRRMYAELKS